MKVKDLIRQLQDADPSGELEACVDNVDIHFVSNEPAYYDGCLQVLRRDASYKFFNVVGAEIRSSGNKIQIHTLSIADLFLDRPNAEITYDSEHAARHKPLVEGWRAEAHKE